MITKEEIEPFINKLDVNIDRIVKTFYQSPRGKAFERRAISALSIQFKAMQKISQIIRDNGQEELADMFDSLFMNKIGKAKTQIREDKKVGKNN